MEPSPTPPPTPTNSGPGGDPSSRIPDPSDQPVMRTRTAPAPFCHRARGSPPAVCARFVLPAPRAPGPPSPVPRRCPTAVVTSPAAMPPSDVHLRERAYMHVRAREFSLVASASALLTDPRSPSLTHTVELRLLSALSRPALALSHPCSRTLRRRLPVSPSSSPLWVGGLRAAPEVQAAPGPPLSRYRWPASPLCAWMASAPPFGRSGPPSPLPPLSPTRGPPAVPPNTAPFSSSIGSISSSSLSILTILPFPLLPPCSPATSRPGGQAAGRAPSVGRLCAPSVGSSPFQHA